jgi:hypothetical protein
MRIIFLLAFIIPTVVFSQTIQGTTDTTLLKLQLTEYLMKTKVTWTKIEKPKAFELLYFKKAGLMPPKTVKRFYKFDNNDSTNYLTTAIYETENFLVKGDNENLYRYYDVSFSGVKDQFTLNYSYSVGLGYTCQGTYFVETGISLQTDYGYGTSSGAITVFQNDKKVYTKKINIKK